MKGRSTQDFTHFLNIDPDMIIFGKMLQKINNKIEKTMANFINIFN